jgi:hypothetical protein
MGFFSSLAGIAGGLLGKAGGALLGSKVPGLGALIGKDGLANAGAQLGTGLGYTITGSPGPTSGRFLGQQAKAYFDAAHPGTTPWERLGTSPMGASGAAHVTAKSQQKMQTKELQTRERIAERQARASTIAAGAPYGPRGIAATQAALDGKEGVQFDTQVGVGRDRLRAEVPKIRADTASAINRAAVDYWRAVSQKGASAVQSERANFARMIAQNEALRDMPNWYKNTAKVDGVLKDLAEGREVVGSGAIALIKKIYETTKSYIPESWTTNERPSGIAAEAAEGPPQPVRGSTHYKTTPDIRP